MAFLRALRALLAITVVGVCTAFAPGALSTRWTRSRTLVQRPALNPADLDAAVKAANGLATAPGAGVDAFKSSALDATKGLQIKQYLPAIQAQIEKSGKADKVAALAPDKLVQSLAKKGAETKAGLVDISGTAKAGLDVAADSAAKTFANAQAGGVTLSPSFAGSAASIKEAEIAALNTLGKSSVETLATVSKTSTGEISAKLAEVGSKLDINAAASKAAADLGPQIEQAAAAKIAALAEIASSVQ